MNTDQRVKEFCSRRDIKYQTSEAKGIPCFVFDKSLSRRVGCLMEEKSFQNAKKAFSGDKFILLVPNQPISESRCRTIIGDLMPNKFRNKIHKVFNEDVDDLAKLKENASRLHRAMIELGLDASLKENGIGNRKMPDNQSVVFFDSESDRELYAVDLRELTQSSMAQHLDRLEDIAQGVAPGASELTRKRIREKERTRQQIAQRYAPAEGFVNKLNDLLAD